MLYRFCDILLASTIPIDELRQVQAGTPDVLFRYTPERSTISPDAWFHHWLDSNQEVWLALAKNDGNYILRFPAFADFLISADTRTITCFSRGDGIPADTIRHLLLDQVLPLVLDRLGRVVIHASAVASSAGAVGLVGMSGRGKSTLATYLVGRGFRFLTDDCLVIRQREQTLYTIPSYPSVRLWDDSADAVGDQNYQRSSVAHYTVKQRLSLPFDVEEEEPYEAALRSMFILMPSEDDITGEIRLEQLSPRDAFMALAAHRFSLDIGDRSHLMAQFERLSQISVLSTYYNLSYPHDFSNLNNVGEVIIRHLHNP